MKVALCLLGCAVLAAAAVYPATKVEKKLADQTFLAKQKQILQLVWRLNQPEIFPNILDVARNYDPQENLDKYTNVESVKNFYTLYKRGMLPQGKIFSVLYEQQRLEMISLFDLFYYAKDFETFYKSAAWARMHINAGQFYYALSVAVLHRVDTQGILLPAPYELYPELFVDAKVIRKAYEKRMTLPVSEFSKGVELSVEEMGMYPYYHHKDTEKHYTYDRNVFGYDSLYHSTEEDRVAYFTEDIALNTWYNYLHLDSPFWMNSTYGYKTEDRGEYFYYTHQQLLARYVLERFSNDLGDVEMLNWEEPLEHGYNPELTYPNGQHFPIRADHTDIRKLNEYEIQLVLDFERRILDAIDSGYIFSNTEHHKLTEENGIDMLGRMIESTVDSVHYSFYGKLYHLSLQILGHIHENQVVPGVIENYETLLRDPAYYRLLARITRLFLRYKSILPKYLREELMFPGVKVESVEVDKLITYFDEFKFDITSSVMISKPEEELIVKAKQYRINHKPFTYKINVNSDKASDAMVRIFLGPKYDTEGRILGLNEKRRLMVELDRFPYKLVSGVNTISRNSHDIFSAIEDVTTVRDLYSKVYDALQGKGEFYVEETDRHCGYPHRLLLPKGKRGGMPFTLYVTVTPIVGKTRAELPADHLDCTTGFGLYFPDQFALGFPFDRVIDETQFYVPNFFEKDVIIFHKRAEEMINQSI